MARTQFTLLSSCSVTLISLTDAPVTRVYGFAAKLLSDLLSVHLFLQDNVYRHLCRISHLKQAAMFYCLPFYCIVWSDFLHKCQFHCFIALLNVCRISFTSVHLVVLQPYCYFCKMYSRGLHFTGLLLLPATIEGFPINVAI